VLDLPADQPEHRGLQLPKLGGAVRPDADGHPDAGRRRVDREHGVPEELSERVGVLDLQECLADVGGEQVGLPLDPERRELDGGLQERRLGAELLHRHDGDAGTLRDLLERRRLVPVTGERLRRRLHDPPSGLGGLLLAQLGAVRPGNLAGRHGID